MATTEEELYKIQIEEKSPIMPSTLTLPNDPSLSLEDCYLTKVLYPHCEYSDQIITGMVKTKIEKDKNFVKNLVNF